MPLAPLCDSHAAAVFCYLQLHGSGVTVQCCLLWRHTICKLHSPSTPTMLSFGTQEIGLGRAVKRATGTLSSNGAGMHTARVCQRRHD